MALDATVGTVEAATSDGLRVKGIEALVTLVQAGHAIDEAHSYSTPRPSRLTVHRVVQWGT
jgi:hypothetical protein